MKDTMSKMRADMEELTDKCEVLQEEYNKLKN